MSFRIVRQNIEFEGCRRHRVVVYNGRMIAAIAESVDPKKAYKIAREHAGVVGRVPVEVLDDHVEDWNEVYH